MNGKLRLDSLDVTSFVVAGEESFGHMNALVYGNTSRQTAMTYCFICPVERVDPGYVAPAEPAEPISDPGIVVVAG